MQDNFVCAIEDNARRFPNKTAIICAAKKLSWSDLDACAAGFAQQLSRQSIAAGDRVAILLPNGLEFVIALMAILKLGATPAPLNPQIKEDELAAFTNDLRPKLTIEQVAVRSEERRVGKECR